VREKEGHAIVALMVTDIMGKGSKLYVSGERPAVERAFGRARDGDDGGGSVIDLPGVMSRKKQVAPKLLAALSG
jgi:manganese-dependent inorganic pyrophosphatase